MQSGVAADVGGCSGGGGVDLLGGHVLGGEVAEGRVLHLREQLVVRGLEGLAGVAGQELFEVVLNDHSRSVRDLGHVHTADGIASLVSLGHIS